MNWASGHLCWVQGPDGPCVLCFCMRWVFVFRMHVPGMPSCKFPVRLCRAHGARAQVQALSPCAGLSPSRTTRAHGATAVGTTIIIVCPEGLCRLGFLMFLFLLFSHVSVAVAVAACPQVDDTVFSLDTKANHTINRVERLDNRLQDVHAGVQAANHVRGRAWVGATGLCAHCTVVVSQFLATCARNVERGSAS